MRSIFDYKHVSGTTGICLLNAKTKEYCGRIVGNWSDNPNGAVFTCSVMLHSTNSFGKDYRVAMGRAGGYGYDKVSSSIYQALKKLGLEKEIKVEPASGNQRTAFEEAGFTWIEVV
jgi:hypothetical protein